MKNDLPNGRLAIRQFLKDLLRHKGDLSDFADGEQLITRGRLQSVDVVELVVFLEQNFGIDFGEHGLDPDELDSVDNIVALVGQCA